MSFLNDHGLKTQWTEIQSSIARALQLKVTKVEGKGLSTNDYTNEEKETLAELAKSSAGAVRSVNSTTPDENGNIALEIASSWNDLTDKPFYSQDVLIEWDGDTSADDQIVLEKDSTWWYVKVADSTYTPEEMMCLSIGQVYNGSYKEGPVSELAYSGLSLNSDNTLFMFGTMTIVAYEANITLSSGIIGGSEITFPEKGTYFAHVKTGSQDTYITHLSGTILKQIDEKYIPDSLKTHGVIGTEDGEVVLEPVSVEGGTMLTDPFQITLEAGKTYSVAIDDDKYICECTVMQGGLVIGDGNAAMSPPFAILVMNGTVQVMISAAGTHTISVTECKEIVKTLDERFLPDSVKGVVFDYDINTNAITCGRTYEEVLELIQNNTWVTCLYRNISDGRIALTSIILAYSVVDETAGLGYEGILFMMANGQFAYKADGTIEMVDLA